ncbi:MAG: hypothetical protein ACP5FT_02280 [Acidilobus sp.]
MTVDMKRFREAVKEYNKYRAPEAFARIVTRKGDTVYVMFDGTYCETCGLYDWIDDLKYVLEGRGIRTEIVKLREPEGPTGSRRIAAFRVIGEPVDNT